MASFVEKTFRGAVKLVEKNPFMVAAAALSLATGNPAAVMALSQAATAAGATTYAVGAVTGSNDLKSAGAYVGDAGVQGMVGSAGAGAARGAWASSDGFMSRLSGAWEGAKGTFFDGSKALSDILPEKMQFIDGAEARANQAELVRQVEANKVLRVGGGKPGENVYKVIKSPSGVKSVTYGNATFQQMPLNQDLVNKLQPGVTSEMMIPGRLQVTGAPTRQILPLNVQVAKPPTDGVAPAAAAPADAVPSGFLNKALHYAPLLNMAGDAIGGTALGAYGAEDAERKFELAKEKHELEMELYRQRIENLNAPGARYGGPTRRSPRFRPQAQQRRQQQAEALKVAQERPQRQRLMPPAGRSFS